MSVVWMTGWYSYPACLFVDFAFSVFSSRFCLPYCGLLVEPLAAVNVTCKCAFPFPAAASHTISLTTAAPAQPPKAYAILGGLSKSQLFDRKLRQVFYSLFAFDSSIYQTWKGLSQLPHTPPSGVIMVNSSSKPQSKKKVKSNMIQFYVCEL